MWQCWHIQGLQDAQEILGEQGLLQWLSLQGCFHSSGLWKPPSCFQLGSTSHLQLPFKNNLKKITQLSKTK